MVYQFMYIKFDSVLLMDHVIYLLLTLMCTDDVHNIVQNDI